MRDFIECFLDDEYISGHDNIVRRLYPAYKLRWNPVLRPEHPWEMADPPAMTAPSVVKHVGSADIAMYYRCRGARDGRWMVCMAESADGRSWHKPALEIHRSGIKGDRTNILVRVPDGIDEILSFWVLRNPYPEESYIFLALVETLDEDGRRSAHVLGSMDAIHWDISRKHTFLTRQGDARPSLLRCDDGLFRAFILADAGSGFRTIDAMCSTDLVDWSAPESLLSITDEDAVSGVRLMGMNPTKLGPFYLGLLSVSAAGCAGGDSAGPARLELAFSRDGARWGRVCPGCAFVEPGEPGSWDAGMVCQSSGLFEIGNAWLLTYGAGAESGESNPPLNIGVAWTERGRIIGIHQADSERCGTLITTPVALEGGNLIINADNARGIRISLLTDDNQPVAGAAAANSRLGRKDDCRWIVTWEDATGAESFNAAACPKPLKICFEISGGAVLHAFETAHEQGRPYQVNIRDFSRPS
ncbi:MAG TPA: hypothetical protein PL033_16675 [Candidatus Brocadiia bacterium]|nr:hypothetical protein [Candidatus Brocadiia bacterium]